MSTLSYLRSALTRAEKRARKYAERERELEARWEATQNLRDLRRVQDFRGNETVRSARTAVTNLTRALEREESRLYADAEASL